MEANGGSYGDTTVNSTAVFLAMSIVTWFWVIAIFAAFVWIAMQKRCPHCGATEGNSIFRSTTPVCQKCGRDRRVAKAGPGTRVSQARADVTPPPAPATTQPPPGWYANPNGNGQRWWDGSQWTEHVQP